MDFQFEFDIPPAPPVVPGGAQVIESAGGGSGAFGSGTFGSMTFGSGSGIAVVGAEQVTLNRVRVFFSGPVSMNNRGAIFDALYDRGWYLSSYNDPGVHVPFVYWVERDPDNTTAVVLHLDAPLDGPGKVYVVTVSPEIVPDGDFSDRSWLFRTFGAPRTLETPRTRRSFDIANQPSGDAGPGQEPVLGTLRYGADGDFANDAGLANYKKRVIRRLTTRRGTFVGLPNYGMILPEKGPIRPGDLRGIQSQAITQVLAEPDTINCDVSVAVPEAGVLLLSVTGVSRAGAFGVDVLVGKGGDTG